ncbi:hypothetical protein GCM10027160_04440 [Streptomyces calidiresistens]|uniref:Uncharacterized protein n=1 Tax=Streptomyces calidiresistens TaxID=1485586 RepID=A0A7W3T4R3_9ACTN|nr:hypothetical protein [Streptomyces calidiresistens]MBB0230925.1 hypothetical protein [Streptomyces calidiresistens]
MIDPLIGAGATVLAALVTAVIGAVTDTLRVEVGAPEPTPTVTETVTQPPVVDPPEDPEDPEDPDPEPAAATVRRSEQSVRLAADHSIDLDSRDDNWGVTTEPGAVGGDLRLDSHNWSGLKARHRMAVVERREPDFLLCRNAMTLVDSVPHDELRDDVSLCVRTSEGRWARVDVVRVSPDPRWLDLDVHVWEGTAPVEG